MLWYIEFALPTCRVNTSVHECVFGSEIKKIQLSARDHFQKIFNDHAKLKQQLESEKTELEVRVHELEKREAKNENERKKLQEDVEKVNF